VKRLLGFGLLLAACTGGPDAPEDPLEAAIRAARDRRAEHIDSVEGIEASLVSVRHDLPRKHGDARSKLQRKLARANKEIEDHLMWATIELRVAERLGEHRGEKRSAKDVDALVAKLRGEEHRKLKPEPDGR